MSQIEGTIRCDNCGIEITWGPWMVDHYHYCCQDCYEGLTCLCVERMIVEEELRAQELQSDS